MRTQLIGEIAISVAPTPVVHVGTPFDPPSLHGTSALWEEPSICTVPSHSPSPLMRACEPGAQSCSTTIRRPSSNRHVSFCPDTGFGMACCTVSNGTRNVRSSHRVPYILVHTHLGPRAKAENTNQKARLQFSIATCCPHCACRPALVPVCMMGTHLQITGSPTRTGRFPVISHTRDLHAIGMLPSYLLCFLCCFSISSVCMCSDHRLLSNKSFVRGEFARRFRYEWVR